MDNNYMAIFCCISAFHIINLRLWRLSICTNFFDINLFLIGIFSGLIWYYATKKGFVDKKLTQEKILEIRKMNLILPVVALIAIGIIL